MFKRFKEELRKQREKLYAGGGGGGAVSKKSKKKKKKETKRKPKKLRDGDRSRVSWTALSLWFVPCP